jgi:hypothetical protein
LPSLVLIGGFLGAGKTTLLLAAAQRLAAARLRPALILNDQGDDLVDTRLARAAGVATQEIAGACFCCRFSDFVRSAEALVANHPDVILAEPVGSCMDIAATVLRPLTRRYGDRFRIAPFTVLVDPRRARELLAPGADQRLAYLFRNQIAEADLVCFSKSDLGDEEPDLPGIRARRLSARTGEGVAAWLHEVLDGGLESGTRLLDIDYEIYAEAEASLGWLNWHAEVRLRKGLPPAAVAGPFLDRLEELLTAAGAAIAHLKLFARARTGYLKANICHNGDEPAVEGHLIARPSRRHELVLNLRAAAPPEVLGRTVNQAAGELPGRLAILHHQCFRPGKPTPEFRLGEPSAG